MRTEDTDVGNLVNVEEDFVEVTEQIIRDKIAHVLSIWPKLSMSMLQVGIGTALSPKMWHPVLAKMIDEGVVIKQDVGASGPTGRYQNYVVIRLSSTPE